MNKLRLWTALEVVTSTSASGAGVRQFRETYRETLKRLFDFSVALVLLLVLSPVLVIVGCAVAADGGRPVLFRHQRVGRGGRAFKCFKFRTMVRNGDEVLRAHLAFDSQARAEWASTRKLKRDPRVTRLGELLRKSSLDELPQLINVLTGDMSLVGPRPIVRDEVVYYGSKIATYELVNPGLTGPWQVSGRSDVSYENRVAMDCEYVENLSLMKDLQILLKTIPAVLKSSGSY